MVEFDKTGVVKVSQTESGFEESGDIVSIYSDKIQATEFVEN